MAQAGQQAQRPVLTVLPPPPRACSYEGEWVQNKMHGKGKYTDTNGHTWHGQFYNGAGPGLTYILQ